MKRKDINPLLMEQYERLQAEEKRARKLLGQLYKSSSARIRTIAASLFHDCTTGEHVNHAALFRTIKPAQAMDLQRQTAQARRVYGDMAAADFPFTVTRFDRLNRLDAARAQLILNELDTAAEIDSMLYIHIHAHVMMTMAATIGYLELQDFKMTEKMADAATRNDERPVICSLYEQHRAAGEREATLLQQAMTRGEDADKAAALVTDYAEKRAQSNTDRLMFTEDTRATAEAVREVVKDYVEAFYTVCIHDDKTCSTCTGIAAEQQMDPVPIEDFKPGITAPPFHPWCRCGIEVVWLADEV